MSVVFGVLLLLLLLVLGFSSHACGGTGIVVDHHSISKESDEKLNPEARVSIAPLPNDATRDEDDDDLTVENEYSDDERVKASGRSESESVDLVRRGRGRGRGRVPHRKKAGEAEPVFNLDYLPPKTHPPVHN